MRVMNHSCLLPYFLLLMTTLRLVSATNTPLTIVTNVLPPVTVERLYWTFLAATGGYPPYLWSLAFQESVPYPNGFSFTDNGTLSGIATHTGHYTPRLQVQDSKRNVVTHTFSLDIFPSPILAINAGGKSDGRFDQDNSFGTIEGGSIGLTYSVTNKINLTDVINPAPEGVYQIERYGNPNLVYTVAGIQPDMQPRLIVGITYLIRLHFAEIEHTKRGDRQFNVTINGQPVLRNFDILAEAGAPYKALVKEFVATATSIRGNMIGAVIIGLTKGAAGFPVINGIEILPATLLITQIPAALNTTDRRSYELGMRFSSTIYGQIVALRFWKSLSDQGPHVGHLWTSNGTLLSQVNFTEHIYSNWQEASLITPIQINPNELYVVSVNVNQYFVNTPFGLQYPGISNGYLQASSTHDIGNGVFGDIGMFPTSSYHNMNYFCDVVFLSK